MGNKAKGGSRVNLFHLEHAEKPGAVFYQSEEKTLREHRERKAQSQCS